MPMFGQSRGLHVAGGCARYWQRDVRGVHDPRPGELTRRNLFLASIGAYNAGDLDALMGFCAPGIEAFPALPESRALHGRDECRRFYLDHDQALKAVGLSE
jgi:hypothetical protein